MISLVLVLLFLSIYSRDLNTLDEVNIQRKE